MKISTEIQSIANHVGEEKAVEYVAKAGFDAWDFSMFRMCGYNWQMKSFIESTHPLAGKDYLLFARRLKQIGLDNGIVCNQSHAPFPSCCAEIRSYLKRAIECTAEAGGQICIIHPDNDGWHDLHQIPFSLNIDFASVVHALKEIEYKGYFTLEADCYLSGHTKENVFEGVKELAEAARRLAEMYEK